MKQTSASPGGNEAHVQNANYVGVGWLVLSIILFTLVFLPVILL